MTILEPNGAPVDAETLIDDETLNAEAATSTGLEPNTILETSGEGTVGFDLDDMLGEGAQAAYDDQQLAPPTIIPVPRPPILPIRLRTVSGRYRSAAVGFQLELRVDVDGRRPLRRLSGDYFSVSGGTTSYFGSWTVDAVTVTWTAANVVIVGTARTTWTTSFTVARVTIPRRSIFHPASRATITWRTPTGAIGATYACNFENSAFRVVELEEDVEQGVTAFESYRTSSLPSGGAARVLSTAGAYGEAGIQMLGTGGGNTIATAATHVWNNASLHNAMLNHFSRWQERAQFKVWLLHAMRHEYGTGLRGIMFDQQGLQRQGCATFYQMIQPPTAANLREQLYVNVHELGHCFNLFHSFHKSFMNPPLPNRPGSLSWMNYPQNYNPGGGAPSGAAAFWAAFPFQFDALELAHLRHGFRNSVIMGGNPFGTGAALEVSEEYADRIVDTSGLQLRIAVSPERPMLGTPIVVEISLVVERGQVVHHQEQLHPKFGFVQIAVSRPRGDVVAHRPPVTQCVDPDIVRAQPGQVMPVSAYIGYDALVGQVFEDPGTYRIRATYTAPDGAMIVSDTAVVRITAPRDAQDDDVAELMLGDDAGMVLTLLGTDSPHLAEGTEALETVAEQHADHPNAVYAKLALGVNAARPFTSVTADGDVEVRPRDLSRADALLNSAIDASRGDSGLDDMTVYQVMSYLASSHADEGDKKGARELRRDVAALAQSKDAPAAVIEAISGDTRG